MPCLRSCLWRGMERKYFPLRLAWPQVLNHQPPTKATQRQVHPTALPDRKQTQVQGSCHPPLPHFSRASGPYKTPLYTLEESHALGNLCTDPTRLQDVSANPRCSLTHKTPSTPSAAPPQAWGLASASLEGFPSKMGASKAVTKTDAWAKT